MEEEQKKARNWNSKVKSAFLRDQAPDAQMCLVFSDLSTKAARYWYNWVSRSTRTSWKALREGFMAKYGGKNIVSVGRLYYHARKRSNETPLEYLYRLNVAAIRAKIPIRDGSPATLKEHVNHYIGTLEDRDLARMLTIYALEMQTILKKHFKNANTWKSENLTHQWGRANFDSVFRHRRPKFQRNRPGL